MIRIEGVLVSPGDAGVYGERTLKGYRVWDPYRSKLAALLEIDAETDLDGKMKVLYLGAANGTTVSHVADYVDTVYAIEFAPRPMQDLIEVARRRKNIVPIMADATKPSEYAPFVEVVDLIYQDVAQPDQAGIALRNLPFLARGGRAILMLKTRSEDVKKDPMDVLESTLSVLREGGLEVTGAHWLEPYHRDHAAILCIKR